MVSNNIFTIVLLFVLGFIIYLLTRPTSDDEKEPVSYSNKVSYVSNNDYAEYEKFTTDNKVVDPLVISMQEKQNTNTVSPTVMYDNNTVSPTVMYDNNTVSPTVMSNNNAAMINSDQSDLFQYEYDDKKDQNLNFGTNLDNAFNNQFPNLPAQETAPVLDLNKGNVSKYDAKDYLPKEINDQWFDTDFSQAKFNINDDKLINTDKYVIGINTVGQSLKNASYDIRGTIANSKFVVSPWNNSTYEPDYNLKPLC